MDDSGTHLVNRNLLFRKDPEGPKAAFSWHECLQVKHRKGEDETNQETNPDLKTWLEVNAELVKLVYLITQDVTFSPLCPLQFQMPVCSLHYVTGLF